jgi:hypothetical protein
MKKSLLILALAASLSACASFQQGVSAVGVAAVDSAKTANDQAIYVWSTAACATPISAALRNPQVIPALRALCVPASETAPSSLLDSLQAHSKAAAP